MRETHSSLRAGARRVGIIGHPITHSLSPALQQPALDHHGIPARYERFDLEPAAVPTFVDGLRAPEWLGINVTVPHKQLVFRLVDEIGPVAQAVGAVNTIVNRDGRLVGHNTDVGGFRRSLLEEGSYRPGGSVVLLGAGGAARAVGYALLELGVATLTIANRTRERAEELVASFAPLSKNTHLRTVDWLSDEMAAALQASALTVNSTSVGLHAGESPLPDELVPAHGLVLDLIYNPAEPALLATARRKGAATLNGLGMLVYQGADAFELWTGLPAPVDAMRAGLLAALART